MRLIRLVSMWINSQKPDSYNLIIVLLAKETVATTNVVLVSRRGEENNLGNLVTDSMIDYVRQ